MFTSIIDSSGGITVASALICTAVSVALGLLVAGVYMYRNRTNRSYCIALVLLPVIVQVVIMMVNGEIGTGVAVMGAFSLIRFRSVPGRAIDICCIFFAMAIGIATGMGYVAFAAFMAAVVSALLLLLTKLDFGGRTTDLELRIAAPDEVDYTEAFEDLFDKYTVRRELTKVKTANMESRYEARYTVTMKPDANQKRFIDELRKRNGGMTVTLGKDDSRTELL